MYDYYKKIHNGILEEATFNALLPYAIEMLEAVIDANVPAYRLSNFHLEKQPRLYKAVCFQVDYLESQGGIESVLSGQIWQAIKGIETSGFKLSYTPSSVVVNGIAIHPLAYTVLMRTLRLMGLTYRGLE